MYCLKIFQRHWQDVVDKEETGCGSFGLVLKGRHSVKGRSVVVKRSFGEKESNACNVAKEAKMLSSLRSGKIVTFLAVCPSPRVFHRSCHLVFFTDPSTPSPLPRQPAPCLFHQTMTNRPSIRKFRQGLTLRKSFNRKVNIRLAGTEFLVELWSSHQLLTIKLKMSHSTPNNRALKCWSSGSPSGITCL